MTAVPMHAAPVRRLAVAVLFVTIVSLAAAAAIRTWSGERSIHADGGGGDRATIGSADAPARTLDLTAPLRSEPVDLTIALVDAAGAPVPGALVEGAYWGNGDRHFNGFHAHSAGANGVLTPPGRTSRWRSTPPLRTARPTRGPIRSPTTPRSR
ncbi:hypothetical protein [Alienimonas californiensis]|uniref:hypothetical protein n=1 Tax=Alienimonas californiensis TaxID=2527989 RepID=UPI0011A60F96|nr:hypothetical protein [Alienimonas californiensis]